MALGKAGLKWTWVCEGVGANGHGGVRVSGQVFVGKERGQGGGGGGGGGGRGDKDATETHALCSSTTGKGGGGVHSPCSACASPYPHAHVMCLRCRTCCCAGCGSCSKSRSALQPPLLVLQGPTQTAARPLHQHPWHVLAWYKRSWWTGLWSCSCSGARGEGRGEQQQKGLHLHPQPLLKSCACCRLAAAYLLSHPPHMIHLCPCPSSCIVHLPNTVPFVLPVWCKHHAHSHATPRLDAAVILSCAGERSQASVPLSLSTSLFSRSLITLSRERAFWPFLARPSASQVKRTTCSATGCSRSAAWHSVPTLSLSEQLGLGMVPLSRPMGDCTGRSVLAALRSGWSRGSLARDRQIERKRTCNR